MPIHALWNDGRENLLGALLMAGQYVIPEVRPLLPGVVGRGLASRSRAQGEWWRLHAPKEPRRVACGCGTQVGHAVEGSGRVSEIHLSPDE